MPRRVSPSQVKNQLRRAQRDQRQAINKYNNAVRQYNRGARAHNARVRSNQQRLRREIAKLNSLTTTTRYATYSRSVTTLQRSFAQIETAADAGTWTAGGDLFDLSEGEAANSVAVLNALLDAPATDVGTDDEHALQSTSITGELSRIDPDLDARWRGALFALSPHNPDAARHFCTSSRELLARILEKGAPDDAVKASDHNYEKTPGGGVSRRARIRYCLRRQDSYDHELESFVEEDLENVIALFRDFNDGTHGGSGRFDLVQLVSIKKRVEDAIHFLDRIVG